MVHQELFHARLRQKIQYTDLARIEGGAFRKNLIDIKRRTNRIYNRRSIGVICRISVYGTATAIGAAPRQKEYQHDSPKIHHLFHFFSSCLQGYIVIVPDSRPFTGT